MMGKLHYSIALLVVAIVAGVQSIPKECCFPVSESWTTDIGKRENKSNLDLSFLDVKSTECSVLCPIACEKLQAARAGYEPATPAF